MFRLLTKVSIFRFRVSISIFGALGPYPVYQRGAPWTDFAPRALFSPLPSLPARVLPAPPGVPGIFLIFFVLPKKVPYTQFLPKKKVRFTQFVPKKNAVYLSFTLVFPQKSGVYPGLYSNKCRLPSFYPNQTKV